MSSTLALVTGGLTGYSDLVTGGMGQGSPVAPSYPIARFDFESGTLASAGLDDFDSVFSIGTTNPYTGTHSISQSGTAGHDIFTALADSLGGDMTVTGYFYITAASSGVQIQARVQPAGTDNTTNIRAIFNVAGLYVIQDVGGTVTNLSAQGSGVSIPNNVWLCLELRMSGTAISARIINETTGNYFENASGGAGSWVSSVQSATGTLSGGPTGAGSYGVRLANATANTIFFDDLICDPAIPSINNPTFSISSASGTQQLTAGGFTDPLHANPGGVTWASSNTAVATVGATTGLVVATGNGSATITATGIRDTTQTATAAATITGQAAASIATLAGPTIALAGVQSAPFTISLDHNSGGSGIVVSLASTGGSDNFQTSIGGGNVTSITIASGTTSGTFYLTPSATESVSISITTSPVLSYVGTPITCVVASMSVAAFSTLLAQTARAAVSYAWIDGTMGSVPTTGGNSLFVAAGPTLTNYFEIVVSVGSYTNPVSVSNTSYTIAGAPGTLSYVGGGPLIRESDNSLVAVVHCEEWAGGNQLYYWASLGLIRSTDEGVSWTWLGQILTLDLAYNAGSTTPATIGFGAITQIGSYYYLSFTEYTGVSTRYPSVARCLASTFDSAVQAGSVPTFSKYDGSGWTGAGIGGLGAPVTIPAPAGGWALLYDTWWHTGLSAVIGVGLSLDSTGNHSVYTAVSNDAVNWSAPVFVTGPSEYSGAAEYPSLAPVAYGANPRTAAGNTFAVIYEAGTIWSSEDVRERIITLAYPSGAAIAYPAAMMMGL